MEYGLIAVAFVVLLVGVSLLSGRIRIAAPLVLVVVGIAIGYIPGVPLIDVPPEIILLGVLPPLLYSAAVNVPLMDFRRNLRPIAGLSVLLVIMSALIVGAMIHFVLPQVPFAAAVALGAVVAPPDAVAATSVGKRLGLPDRIVSILEGESLVNDATSLVLLRTAVAAVSGGFVFWEAAGSFALSVVAAIVIGYVMGVITVWIRSRLHNPVYDTMISFIVPFVAFLPAEELGASGVLAVVVTGLYTGHHSARRFSAIARTNERLNWRTIQFVLENGVFLVMGLQLHALVGEIDGHGFTLGHVALLSLLVVAVLIVSRAIFVAPLIISMRGEARRRQAKQTVFTRFEHKLRRRKQLSSEQSAKRLERARDRAQADLDHEIATQLGVRDGVVLSWSAMRGVVTLAAAQSIPATVPYRPQIVLIAFLVAVLTLLLHGLTLPLVIRKLWPEGTASGVDRAEFAALGRDLIESGLEAIDDVIEHETDSPDARVTPEAAIERAKSSAKNSLAPLALKLVDTSAIDTHATETPAAAYLRLARAALDAQRTTLLEERAIGRYSSSVLRAAEIALDAHETRLSPYTGGHFFG